MANPSTTSTIDQHPAEAPAQSQNACKTMFADCPDIMTRPQAAEALGMGIREITELLRASKIRAYRDGRRWRIPKASLIAYVEKQIRGRWIDILID